MLTNLKTIHWDFASEGSFTVITDELEMAVGATHNSETDAKTGFYIRWTLRYGDTDLGSYFSYIAESTHKTDVNTLTVKNLTFFVECSFNDFQEAVRIKAGEYNCAFNLSFLLSKEKAEQVLEQLRL